MPCYNYTKMPLLCITYGTYIHERLAWHHGCMAHGTVECRMQSTEFSCITLVSDALIGEPVNLSCIVQTCHSKGCIELICYTSFQGSTPSVPCCKPASSALVVFVVHLLHVNMIY